MKARTHATTIDGEPLSDRRTYRIEWALSKPLVPLKTGVPSRAEAEQERTKLASLLGVDASDLIVVGSMPALPGVTE